MMMSLYVMKYILLVIPALVGVAFITLLERKILSIVGFRVGPNKVSFFGLLQPLADAVKLSNKSINLMTNFSFFFYYLSSFFMIFMSILLFSTLFCFPTPVSIKYTVLLFFLVLGFNSLNSIVAGWSAFSKFSLIGSIRTVSQLISYEGVLYLCIFFFTILLSSFEFDSLSFVGLQFFFILSLPCFYIWIPTFLAELNRTPYDFSEGESELVSGFNTEFGSLSFTLIFLSEYGNIIFFCILSSFLFMFPFILGLFFFLFSVIWFRSVLPRYRFDKLMYLSWKFFIPFLTLYFCLTVTFFI